MDDGLVIGFPYDGDGMAREAIMDDAIVIQDFFNDIHELAAGSTGLRLAANLHFGGG